MTGVQTCALPILWNLNFHKENSSTWIFHFIHFTNEYFPTLYHYYNLFLYVPVYIYIYITYCPLPNCLEGKVQDCPTKPRLWVVLYSLECFTKLWATQLPQRACENNTSLNILWYKLMKANNNVPSIRQERLNYDRSLLQLWSWFLNEHTLVANSRAWTALRAWCSLHQSSYLF